MTLYRVYNKIKDRLFLFYMGLLLPTKQVCSYIKRAEQPFLFFNLEVLIKSRAFNSTSKAIFV